MEPVKLKRGDVKRGLVVEFRHGPKYTVLGVFEGWLDGKEYVTLQGSSSITISREMSHFLDKFHARKHTLKRGEVFMLRGYNSVFLYLSDDSVIRFGGAGASKFGAHVSGGDMSMYVNELSGGDYSRIQRIGTYDGVLSEAYGIDD